MSRDVKMRGRAMMVVWSMVVMETLARPFQGFFLGFFDCLGFYCKYLMFVFFVFLSVTKNSVTCWQIVSVRCERLLPHSGFQSLQVHGGHVEPFVYIAYNGFQTFLCVRFSAARFSHAKGKLFLYQHIKVGDKDKVP